MTSQSSQRFAFTYLRLYPLNFIIPKKGNKHCEFFWENLLVCWAGPGKRGICGKQVCIIRCATPGGRGSKYRAVRERNKKLHKKWTQNTFLNRTGGKQVVGQNRCLMLLLGLGRGLRFCVGVGKGKMQTYLKNRNSNKSESEKDHKHFSPGPHSWSLQ